MQIFHKRNKRYQMDVTLANETLQNVFSACDKEPNTIPFDKILLKQKPETKLLSLGKWLTLFMLIITFLSPLAFRPSPADVSQLNNVNKNLTLLSHYIADNCLYLEFSNNTFDYEKSYMQTSDGELYKPISIDPISNIIVFPYLEVETTIYIFSLDQSSMQLLVSPKK
ncbi:MAG TPA: hypothetical protein VJZ04_09135 [Lachnospiraceae bacterium]|nr:hypothetical protein [Lachnospiraceae bacterium]